MGESHGPAAASPSHQVNCTLATTCATAGILSSTASAIVGHCSEALKLLTVQGRRNGGLLHSDVWGNNFEVFSIKRQQDCTPPGKRRYQFLED
jgi:hypothetical protein